MKLNSRQLAAQFFIDKNFQFSFLKQLLIMSVLLLLIQAGLIHYFQYNYADMLKQIGISHNDSIVVFLNKQTQFLLWTSMTINGLFILIVLYHGLKVSQKIAGPVRRTIEYIKMDQEGSLTFRKNDYFHELADVINEKAKIKKVG